MNNHPNNSEVNLKTAHEQLLQTTDPQKQTELVQQINAVMQANQQRILASQDFVK
ncbi:hypothetical protein LFAB_12665 [Lactiplantibacillus fabifermentans T30PCM01]|uniref:Uncharacterized protein n=1 Tax=Lactiplantibacillus fabifermentans T30PCM01 TaxID=1400520 RepID=W6T673_9LACO|nr:hypothetical protein [Lactiplantibacillus fabifermentans]ETY73388.1 hypothetical protein LFAB_12665 [Lactiplantibacillus fabifermentans T30PCM01]